MQRATILIRGNATNIQMESWAKNNGKSVLCYRKYLCLHRQYNKYARFGLYIGEIRA